MHYQPNDWITTFKLRPFYPRGNKSWYKVDLDVVGKKIFLVLARSRTLIPQLSSQQPSCRIDWTISARTS